MNCGMICCHVVAIVLFAWGPVVLKLSLTFSVVEPMVFRVHCFQFLDSIVVDNPECSGIVQHGFSAVDVECPHLSLCCQGHDRLDNLYDCEDGAIAWRFGCVAGHEEMPTHPATCLCFGEV